jgi:hypothetical protein
MLKPMNPKGYGLVCPHCRYDITKADKLDYNDTPRWCDRCETHVEPVQAHIYKGK